MKKQICTFIFLMTLISWSQKKENTIPKYKAVERTSNLYKTIAKMDSLYFAAQNLCDLETYASFLSEDFEFFHDVAGYTASKDDEIKDMTVFCGEEQRSRQPLRRELIKGSLKVYPMQNFGALEFCDHKFYLQIPDGTEKVIGSGKLTAVWKMINKKWKLTRVISYDHQPLAETELSEDILDRYVGDYIFSDRIVNIKIEGKFLRVTDIKNGKSIWSKKLFPETENTFYLNYENVVYEFQKNESTIIDMNIYEGGKLLEKGKRK
ncbi:nuclear transport factor 2 family protein [Aquimarina litoralis]|uniref:nuclear transport factor 2 family protein n=1 Tax=Aquimarina litoralis TaxID=584605 RepID=UPI001C58604C|nr:nuclear transport factor 2 family protein [Aquimarina litoralis]MBW1294804.1 DUF4440 domain-containing protein [Aquimarina litoralis]